jgi:hypothetical protein
MNKLIQGDEVKVAKAIAEDIARLDWGIDKMVYAVYGLIVEGIEGEK